MKTDKKINFNDLLVVFNFIEYPKLTFYKYENVIIMYYNKNRKSINIFRKYKKKIDYLNIKEINISIIGWYGGEIGISVYENTTFNKNELELKETIDFDNLKPVFTLINNRYWLYYFDKDRVVLGVNKTSKLLDVVENKFYQFKSCIEENDYKNWEKDLFGTNYNYKIKSMYFPENRENAFIDLIKENKLDEQDNSYLIDSTIKLFHINDLKMKFNFFERKNFVYYFYNNKCIFTLDKKNKRIYISQDMFDKLDQLNLHVLGYHKLTFVIDFLSKYYDVKDYSGFINHNSVENNIHEIFNL